MADALPGYREYRLATGWRLFVGFAAPLLVVLFIGMPVLWWLEKPLPLLTALYCALPLGLALLLLYGWAEALWGRVIVAPEGIMEVSILGRRRLAWVEVKGYRITRNYLRLLPTDVRKKPIRIGLLTEQIAEIIDWVDAYYPNLGPPTPVAPPAAPNPAPFSSLAAHTAQERRRAEAQQTVRLLSWASWVATAGLVFYPKPYLLAVTAGLLLPPAAAVAQWLYPGLLRPDEPDGSGKASLGVALVLPGVGLFFRLLFDVELVSIAAIQPWAYAVGGSLALLLVAGSWRHLARDAGQGIIILAAALLYGFSAPVAYNTAFDKSPPTYYTPRLLRKYINTNEFTGFMATVQPWGPFRDSAQVHVSRAHYRKLRPGHPVRIRLMPGALGIPWFRTEE